MTGQPDTVTAVAALDQAIRALVLAKSALLGQGGAALLISSEPVPLASLRDREHYDAASPAGVAEGAEPVSDALAGQLREALAATERGETVDLGDFTQYAALCPAQWGVAPETMLCSRKSGHDGNHATAEGIEWAGQWETAEPGGGAA